MFAIGLIFGTEGQEGSLRLPLRVMLLNATLPPVLRSVYHSAHTVNLCNLQDGQFELSTSRTASLMQQLSHVIQGPPIWRQNVPNCRLNEVPR